MNGVRRALRVLVPIFGTAIGLALVIMWPYLIWGETRFTIIWTVASSAVILIGVFMAATWDSSNGT